LIGGNFTVVVMATGWVHS